MGKPVNCGIYAVGEYLRCKGADREFIALIGQELAKEAGSGGLSAAAICRCLGGHGCPVIAVSAATPPFRAPYIIYLARQRHYMLVAGTGRRLALADQRIGIRRVPAWIIRLIYQRVAIGSVRDLILRQPGDV